MEGGEAIGGQAGRGGSEDRRGRSKITAEANIHSHIQQPCAYIQANIHVYAAIGTRASTHHTITYTRSHTQSYAHIQDTSTHTRSHTHTYKHTYKHTYIGLPSDGWTCIYATNQDIVVVRCNT